MATSREERPYDGGLGTGGKFRKRPFRRSQPSTPYDRPPATALRNPAAADSNGWLSKLVDPAHRLISAGAHRLFSSVFRKRLLPPPSPSPPEAGRELRDEHQEAVSSEPSGAKEMPSNGNNNPSTSSNRGGLGELEQILKQKTFTRSEVDRLTTLLRSRSDEIPIGNEEKRFEMVPSKPMTSLDRKEGYLNTPLQVNGIENHLTSTPVVNATVLEDDVASPTEVAKAYMGSRPSNVSPSMLSFRSQKFREDSNVISNPLLPRSPIMSLVPVASGPVSVPLNGFMTPRSRGRSAIYNMARTPYSRVNRPSTIKDTRTMIDTFGGPSSSTYSHSELELNRPSGSQKGSLKRRSSVLDNDIGSIGPMRRIRQKANLLSQKGLGSPSPAQYPSSSKMLLENGDKNIPDTTVTPVPSKSKEIASKILQQLEKFTPNEKSPTKLSPSMLRGKALKSLESPDTTKVFEKAHDMNKLDGLVDSSLPDGQKSTSQKKEQDVVNGPTKFLSLCNASAVNSVDNMVLAKDTVPSVNIDNTRLANTTARPPQRKRAFQMSAHEDFVDLDDEILSNGVASSPSVEPKAKLDTSVLENRTVTPEAVKVVKPSSEDKPPAGSVSNEKSNGSIVDVKSSGFAFSAASSMTVQPAMGATQTSFASDKPAFLKESNGPHPIYSFGNQVAPSKEPIAGSPTSDLGSKNAGKTSQSLFAASSTLADSSGLKWSSPVSPGAINSAPEVPAPAEARSENNSNSGVKSESLPETPETAQVSAISKSTPSAGIITFGGSGKSTLNNGSHSSSTSPLSSSVPHLFSGNSASQNSFSNAGVASQTNSTTATSSSLPLSSPGSSLTATPTIKFGSSAVLSSSVLPASGGSVLKTEEATVKQDASFGNSSSVVFGGATSAPANTGSNLFWFSAPAAAASTASSQSQVSTLFGTSNGSLSSPAGSAVGAVTQSLPTQFGSSGSTSSFGLPSSSSFSFGSSTFGSSTSAATLFSSGSGFGASVSANAVSSSSGTTSGLFGSSEQPTKSPIFGSFNSSSASTGFSFGASSASAASTTTAAMPFGSSTTPVAPASSSPMPFGSSTASVAPASSSPMPFGSSTTSVAPASSSSPMTFGSSTSFGAVTNSATVPFGSTGGSSSGSPFSFTSAASNGTSLGSGFNFTSASPSTSKPVFSSPSPGFGFGAASSPAGNDQMNTDSMAEDNVQASTAAAPTFSQQPFLPAPSTFTFGSTAAAPSPGANPFQFGGQQQNAATQPFQFGGPQQSAATQPFQFGGPQQNTAATQPFQFGGPQQNTATQQQSAASPFQASGSLDFNASGNFSLGSGGGDKSNRRIVKVTKGKYRRK